MTLKPKMEACWFFNPSPLLSNINPLMIAEPSWISSPLKKCCPSKLAQWMHRGLSFLLNRFGRDKDTRRHFVSPIWLLNKGPQRNGALPRNLRRAWPEPGGLAFWEVISFSQSPTACQSTLQDATEIQKNNKSSWRGHRDQDCLDVHTLDSV